jgi:type III secretory pathway lipoprotein EscJ
MRSDEARRPAGQAGRGGLDGLRAWLAGARARWVLVGLGALIALIAAAHQFGAGEPGSYEWLDGGARRSTTEAARVVAALRAAEIPCVESNGRVGVPAARRADALAVLARGKLGPRSFDELQDEIAAGGSILETPADRARRERRGRERLAAEAIERLPGVVAASVVLTGVESGSRLHPRRTYQATAFVEAEPGRDLPYATVRLIRTVLTRIEDVAPEGVTVLDLRTGREYLVAGQPEVEARSAVRMREQELREAILDQLNIEGARVLVRIDAPAEVAPAPAPTAQTQVNRPIGDVDDPGAPPTGAPAEPPATGRATVLVRVPRSYYLRLFHDQHPNQSPTPEDLGPYVAGVDRSIRTLVALVVPPREFEHELKIERIDDLGPPRPVVAPSSGVADGRRPGLVVWLPVAGGVTLAVLVLAALGGGWLAGRRPVRGAELPARLRPPPEPTAAPTAAGPGERVRELVRLDPGAAAGVLHRWIAMGGPGR